jgi:2C-methyl-D-erythritol 2,4-cyclodiphosphate synthase
MVANHSTKQFAEVWGDTLVLKELFLSAVLGIALTMAGYLIGVSYFAGIKGLSKSLITGYALMTGIVGCVAAGVIASMLYKPKRTVEDMIVQEDIAAVLKAGDMTLEEETLAMNNLDKQVLAEMQELNLQVLLDLRTSTKGGDVK